MQLRKLSSGLKTAYRGSNVTQRLEKFNGWIDGANSKGAGSGKYNHTETVKEYYDLCGEFMVFGWGESLHFTPLEPGLSLEESKVRHQQTMIAKLDLREGMTVVDVGCGIGGPMRRVAKEANVRVVGVNINEIQLKKARSLNASSGLDHILDCVACDFMDMGIFKEGTFDRAYAIESTCHAQDKSHAFAEIFRILKPGALLWGQEMCMTNKFNPSDSEHLAIRKNLMHGIALKDIATTDKVNRALETAGFEVVEGTDHGSSEGTATPWYRPMEARRGTPGNLVIRTPLGRRVLMEGMKFAEALKLFPKGSSEVVRMMDRTADAYVAGGRAEIFTPLYCFLARKPL